jgi:hypothetical protein
VDISGLKEIGDAIHVRDLKPLPGVTYLTNEDDLVLKISPLAVQAVEAAPVVTEAVAEVEVIKKGKEEKAEGEGESEAAAKPAKK